MADMIKTEPATADPVDADELIALIKAIKFAHEDYGYKRVHDQIKTHGEKYARVPLKRVKKYMQKLGLSNAAQADEDDAESSETAANTGSESKFDLKAQAKASAKDGAIQIMTVGGKSKSERPNAPHSNTPAAATASDEAWLPVKLDEPASKTGKLPYEAVIRMTGSEEGDASGALGEIYKIQVAMEADGSLSNVSPMLVYNKARNRKTFLHTDSPAYHPVQRLIKGRGLNGVVGGAKAYFWGRYREEDDMLYINTEKLAPFQKW